MWDLAILNLTILPKGLNFFCHSARSWTCKYDIFYKQINFKIQLKIGPGFKINTNWTKFSSVAELKYGIFDWTYSSKGIFAFFQTQFQNYQRANWAVVWSALHWDIMLPPEIEFLLSFRWTHLSFRNCNSDKMKEIYKNSQG